MKFKTGDKIIRNKTCPQSIYRELKNDIVYTISRSIELRGNIYDYELREIKGNYSAIIFSQENIDKYFDLFNNNYARSLKIKKLKETIDENTKV